MIRCICKYKIIMLLICSYALFPTPISLAESGDDSKRQLFLVFKSGIFDIIESGLEPLNKLDEDLDEESLYSIALSSEQSLAKSSLALSELGVPIALPHDIKILLERAKGEISIGFKALGESMNFFAQYIVYRSPLLYDKSIEKRDKGFLYIDGGLTTLATARLQLDAPEEPIQNVWEVGKRRFYQFEKAIPVKCISNDN